MKYNKRFHTLLCILIIRRGRTKVIKFSDRQNVPELYVSGGTEEIHE
jgi:hypothetical protein